MLQLNNLNIEGFGSIQSFTINLNQKGITLIRGANGEGKSTIVSSIVWCIYGKNIKGISEVETWKPYRTSKHQGTKIELHFKSNGSYYKIIRCQNYKGEVDGAKGNNRLLFYKEAELVSDKKKGDIQALINQAIGMSYQVFMSSVMFGQGMSRVIQDSNNDQKKIFEEIFNLSYISTAQQIAKQEYNNLNEDFIKQTHECESLSRSIETYRHNLQMNKAYTQKVKEEHQVKVSKLESEVKLATKELKKLEPLPEINETRVKKFKTKLTLLKQTLNDIEDELDGYTLEDVLEDILQLLKKKSYNKVESTVKHIKNKYVKVDNLRSEISTVNSKLYKAEEQLQHVKSLHNDYKREESYLTRLKRNLENVKNEKVNKTPVMKDISQKMKKLKADLSQAITLHEYLKEQTDIMKWVYTEPLGQNGLKTYIFQNSLEELNTLLKEYSDILGIHINFTIDINTTRKEFETVIYMNGITVLFEELSGGQKQLVHLAMALAMNQLVTKNYNINLAFMDEVFESLSHDNIEIVVTLLRKVYKDKNLFLITHHDSLPIGNARTIQVSKENGLSKYNL